MSHRVVASWMGDARFGDSGIGIIHACGLRQAHRRSAQRSWAMPKVYGGIGEEVPCNLESRGRHIKREIKSNC
jgi:hypothetical protein